MPPYTVFKLRTREELDAIVEIIFQAQYSPYMPSTSIYFPVSGYSSADRAAGMQAAKERLWQQHLSTNPDTNTWIYVPKVKVHWWLEGEGRDFCEETIRQNLMPRSFWMQVRHAGLSTMVVHPSHRSRGVGSLMMEWVNRRIDEMGIEGFIESSPLGRKLYEKWGYKVVMKLDWFVPAGKPDVWNKLANDLIMPSWYAMWRPVRGVGGEGERSSPFMGVCDD